MVGPIRDLVNAMRAGGAVKVECNCGRVAIFAPADLYYFFKRKGLTTAWPAFARHLRCTSCNQRGGFVSWVTDLPPDDDPSPQRPRFSRPAVSVGQSEWEAAKARRTHRLRPQPGRRSAHRRLMRRGRKTTITAA